MSAASPVYLTGTVVGKASNAGQAAWFVNEALHREGVSGNHVQPKHLRLANDEWRAL